MQRQETYTSPVTLASNSKEVADLYPKFRVAWGSKPLLVSNCIVVDQPFTVS